MPAKRFSWQLCRHLHKTHSDQQVCVWSIPHPLWAGGQIWGTGAEGGMTWLTTVTSYLLPLCPGLSHCHSVNNLLASVNGKNFHKRLYNNDILKGEQWGKSTYLRLVYISDGGQQNKFSFNCALWQSRKEIRN